MKFFLSSHILNESFYQKNISFLISGLINLKSIRYYSNLFLLDSRGICLFKAEYPLTTVYVLLIQDEISLTLLHLKYFLVVFRRVLLRPNIRVKFSRIQMILLKVRLYFFFVEKSKVSKINNSFIVSSKN